MKIQKFNRYLTAFFKISYDFDFPHICWNSSTNSIEVWLEIWTKNMKV